MKQLLPIMNDFFMPCEKTDHERERFILPKHHNALRLRPRTSAGPLNVARKASSTSNNAIGMGYPCVFSSVWAFYLQIPRIICKKTITFVGTPPMVGSPGGISRPCPLREIRRKLQADQDDMAEANGQLAELVEQVTGDKFAIRGLKELVKE